MSVKNTFSIISLGCPKNTVDSEILRGGLEKSGFQYVPSGAAEIAIINTCGFIESAREESIQTILEAINAKNDGDFDQVYVTGCLSQRYTEELRKELPEADGIFGVSSHNELINTIMQTNTACFTMTEDRNLLTPPHFAYLKIAEGCDNKCAFCSIPIMRGSQVSREIDEIMVEAKYLHEMGVKEVVLIAQDLTRYGDDFKDETSLYAFLNVLLEAKLFPWVRLMYANPGFWDHRINSLFNKYSELLPYLDIPVQHAADSVLKNMRRGITMAKTIDTLEKIRQDVPQIALRTSLLVGFPGESEDDFRDLMDFVEKIKFDRLGVFTYSEEEGTFGATLKNDVPEKVKNQREGRIMDIQLEIACDFAEKQIGKTLPVIIESREGDYFVGRSVYDAPEIDCVVYIDSLKPLIIGDIYSVKITKADEMDLIATFG